MGHLLEKAMTMEAIYFRHLEEERKYAACRTEEDYRDFLKEYLAVRADRREGEKPYRLQH